MVRPFTEIETQVDTKMVLGAVEFKSINNLGKRHCNMIYSDKLQPSHLSTAYFACRVLATLSSTPVLLVRPSEEKTI
jgi:hypothetical protein